MKVCVVGRHGQLGGALEEAFASQGVAVWRPDRTIDARWDLQDIATKPESADRLLASSRAPWGSSSAQWVILAAAMTNVDGCEAEPALAYAINTDAPRAIARAARAIGARTIFFSTDYVFDGTAGPYSEQDTPHPLSVYGRSKLHGEQGVLQENPDSLVVRTTTLYGPEDRGLNFAYRLANYARIGHVTRVPSDQFSTPTYNRDLATFVVRAVAENRTGLVHFAGPESMSRVELAERLARAGGFWHDVRLEAVPTEGLGQAARRPLKAGLVSIGGRRVEDAVRDWIARPCGRQWP